MNRYYLSAPVDEVELAAKVAPAVAELDGRLPGSAALRDLARERGLDFSTMYLYQAIRSAPPHRAFIEALDAQPAAADRSAAGAKVLTIPALFHGHYPETGADAALVAHIADNCGFATEKIPIPSVGTIAGNAAIINRHLEQETAEHLWIFSVSKGSADFRAFLQLYGDCPAIDRIRGWINVCGLANGCQISDYNVATPLRALKYRAICKLFGVSFELMRELSTAHSLWRTPLQLPAHIQLLNFMAVPLPCHLQKSVMGRYLAISDLGPNDGMVVCRNSALDPGPIYPVWGSDHFFRAPQIPGLLYRLFRHLRRL